MTVNEAGRIGGSAKSAAKAAAARANGALGGRPRTRFWITEEHLGPTATEEEARRMVDLLRERGYDVRYGAGKPGPNDEIIPDDVWEELIKKV